MDSLKNFAKSFLGVVVIILGLALFGAIGFRCTFVNFVDNYEIGYTYDAISGKIERLKRTGYIVTPPLIKHVHTIDGRPMQVCISSINRVLNCKLVQFNPAGLEVFLAWHGRDNYDNNSVSRESTPSLLNQILMAYAYEGSGKSYPFLTIIRELKTEELGEIQK